MVLETILGIAVGGAFVWLFVYSAALIGAKHALRDHVTTFTEEPEAPPVTI